MTSSQRVAVIVDPYSSGRFLVSELALQKWPIVCIQSSQDLAPFWLSQMEPDNFLETIHHESFGATLAALRKFDVAAVMPGSEPGVLLAEDLQETLNLPCNGAATKMWRRNKYDMHERLREVGLRAIRQTYSGDIDEALQWRRSWNQWPVIVKPAMSGGTDGVYWCHSETDVREAFDAECGKLNCNGLVNEKLLVQEYLDGLEYMIDCVSFEGKHVVCAMWIVKKLKDPLTKSISYEYARIIESFGEVQEELIDYVFKCLDALSVRYGATHNEVIMCEDGPCLVETGARMHGLTGPLLTELATGVGTHELVVDVCLNDGRLVQELFKRDYRYLLKKWVFETVMRSRKTGTLRAPIDEQKLLRLPTVMDVFTTVRPGQELKITRDLATAPGIILQVHTSLQACFDDVSTLRKLEEANLFQLVPRQSGWRPQSSVPAPPSSMDTKPKPSPMRLKRQTSPFTISPTLRPSTASTALDLEDILDAACGEDSDDDTPAVT